MFKTGQHVKILPQWCNSSEEREMIYICRSDEDRGRVDISAVMDWQLTIIPIETVDATMLEPCES